MKNILVIDDGKRRNGLIKALMYWKALTGANARYISVIDESMVRDTTRAIGAVGRVSSAVTTEFIKERKAELVEALKGLLTDVEIDVKSGNPLEEIKGVIERTKPELLIMSHRVKTGVINITDEIVGFSKGNCFLVPQDNLDKKYRKILVAIEELKTDSPVIKSAFQLSSLYNSRLLVLNIIVFNDQIVINAPEMIEKSYSKSREFFGKIKVLAEKQGIQINTLIKEGDHSDVLSQVALREHPDLIVLEGYSRTGLSRILMGNEVSNVVKKVNCPVLIVKKPLSLL